MMVKVGKIAHFGQIGQKSEGVWSPLNSVRFQKSMKGVNLGLIYCIKLVNKYLTVIQVDHDDQSR